MYIWYCNEPIKDGSSGQGLKNLYKFDYNLQEITTKNHNLLQKNSHKNEENLKTNDVSQISLLNV
jgi:hypothetical protein